MLGDVDEEGEVEVFVAPSKAGTVFSIVAPDEGVLDESIATGIVEDPAAAVDVADTASPLHAETMAVTPLAPLK